MQTLFTKTQDLAYAPPWSDYRPRVFVSPHMPAARGAMSTSQNSILKAIVAHDYEFALLIDCQTGRFTSCHSSQDYEIFPKEGNYHEELIAASEQRIYPSDRRHFLHSLTIDAMREALERSQQRVLFRRFSANGQIVWVEANFFYISEARDEIVLTCYPNNPQAADLPAGNSPLILPYQQGMQMGDNDMFTNFLVADLENDRCVRPPHTDGNLQDTVSFRKQIEWFANNLLVPEQREEYLRFFEPETLCPCCAGTGAFTARISRCKSTMTGMMWPMSSACFQPHADPLVAATGNFSSPMSWTLPICRKYGNTAGSSCSKVVWIP